MILTKDRLYFYNTDHYETDTFNVCQYDAAGDYKFSYSIPWVDENEVEYMVYQFKYEDINSLVVTFYSANGDLREYNLEDGQVRLIKKIKDGKFDVDGNDGDDYYVKRPWRRLDRELLPVYYEEGDDHQQFCLIDVENRKKSKDIVFDTLSKFNDHKFSLNWNMEEAAITSLLPVGDGYYEMDFKIFHFDFVEKGLSLKHLARLAVLTSFSEEDLVHQHLPTHLFEYLGIRM
eukprot:TCONS_00050405-protein